MNNIDKQLFSSIKSKKPTFINNRSSHLSVYFIIGIVIFLFIVVSIVSYMFIYISSKKNQSVSQLQQQTVVYPALSPQVVETPKEISFLREGNIWLANTDGSNQRQVTRVGNIKDFYWISKSNKLVFSMIIPQENENIAEIHLLDIKDNIIKIIYRENIGGGHSADFFYFKVSPDGRIVSYPSTKGIVLFDLGNDTKQEIFESGIQPIFSPDGQMLAGIFEGNIYVLSLKDLSKKQLTTFVSPQNYIGDYSAYEYPKGIVAWSSDGKKILYYFGNYGQGSTLDKATHHIYQIEMQSLKAIQLTSSSLGEEDYFLDQTIEGSEIYYLVFDSKLYRYFLKKKDMKNGTIIPINLTQGLDLSPAEFKLDVALDGSKVVYEWFKIIPLENKPFSPTKTVYEVWVMNPDSSDNHKLLDNASNPKWKY